jgi:hypothetical protein
VTTRPMRSSVDASLVAQPAGKAVAPSGARSWRTIPLVASEPREIDACLHMFALCKLLQMTCLDRVRVDYLADGERVGRLPDAVCRILGLMVCELVKDASGRFRRIAVTLRRRGTTCLCTISCQDRREQYEDAQPGLQRVLQLATELRGCMIRPMSDRGITAIMFDVHLVEQNLPAAIPNVPS